MTAPIFVLLGIFGGFVLLPESIDQKSLSELNSQSYASVGTAEMGHIGKQELLYPDLRADYIYGGVTWYSLKPRVAVDVSARGDMWAGAGVDFEKYWSLDKEKAFFAGVNFLPGVYRAGGVALGNTVEFRSQLEFGLVTKDKWRISMFIEHRSNAGLGKSNPGVEAVGVNIGYQL